jgi:hypothetical protein
MTIVTKAPKSLRGFGEFEGSRLVWGRAEPAFHLILAGLKGIVVPANFKDRKASGRAIVFSFAMVPSISLSSKWSQLARSMSTFRPDGLS